MTDLRWLAARSRVLGRVYGDAEPPDWAGARWLRPGEVAALLQVSRRTVSDWARAGRLESLMTPGGHRRFRADHVRALLESLAAEVSANAEGPRERPLG